VGSTMSAPRQSPAHERPFGLIKLMPPALRVVAPPWEVRAIGQPRRLSTWPRPSKRESYSRGSILPRMFGLLTYDAPCYLSWSIHDP
jgi:hypothetical protein